MFLVYFFTAQVPSDGTKKRPGVDSEYFFSGLLMDHKVACRLLLDMLIGPTCF